MFTIYATGMKK